MIGTKRRHNIFYIFHNPDPAFNIKPQDLRKLILDFIERKVNLSSIEHLHKIHIYIRYFVKLCYCIHEC